MRETVRYYPQLSEELIRVVGVHPGNFILLELREELGRYAERKLRDHKVEVIKGPRVRTTMEWCWTRDLFFGQEIDHRP